MIPLEIHDRGRGPELVGTRLTVYDIIPCRLVGRTAEYIAEAHRPQPALHHLGQILALHSN